jgi:uncharacterized protein (DUF2062 family)
MYQGFLQRRVVRPVIDLLKQGVTPEKMALSLALGAALGVFPALGWTTSLCAIAALALRLNLPAIQIVNYFVYPAQIALLLPFFRLGEKLFRAPHLPISVSQIYAMIQGSLWGAMMAPLVVGLLYALLAPLLRRVLRRQAAQPAPTEEAT